MRTLYTNILLQNNPCEYSNLKNTNLKGDFVLTGFKHYLCISLSDIQK